MGPRPHSASIQDSPAADHVIGHVTGHALLAAMAAGPSDDGRERAPARPSAKARKASAPYAHKTRGYFRTLSATSVGLEMAVSVVLPLLLGIWLDRKVGTAPWLMLLFLCFGFAAGIRAVWRYVAEADRDVRESEEEAAADMPSTSPPTSPPPSTPSDPDDDARGGA